MPLLTQTEKDVVAFLGEELGALPDDVSVWTRLRQDLRVDGDAANGLLADFSYVFAVDMAGFRVNDYFRAGDGGAHPVLSAILWLFGNAKPLKTLTVRDLVRAADAGRFFSPLPER